MRYFIDLTGLAIRALTEIAAERGLSVSWNGVSGEGWAVIVDGHIFTLNYQHTDGDWYLNLDGFAQSGDVLSLHSDDNEIFIDESLFNCWINDGSGAREIKYEWYVGAAVAVVIAPYSALGQPATVVLGSIPQYIDI